MVELRDTRGRPLRDLRISVTDRCNMRCRYCMPREVFGSDFAKRMPTGNIPIDRGQDRLPPSGPRQLRFRDRRNRTNSVPIRYRAGIERTDRMHRHREADLDVHTYVRCTCDRPRHPVYHVLLKQEAIRRWRQSEAVQVNRGLDLEVTLLEDTPVM